jgi:hypothetical protein
MAGVFQALQVLEAGGYKTLINIWSAVETTEGGTWTKVFTSNH